MSRADRLLALVHLLSGARRRTLTEIAGELEMSARSIYRDLADLETRGMPIERVDGTYRLMDSARMRPLALTARERLLLSMVIENPALLGQRAFAKDLRSLRNKLSAETAAEGETVAALAGPDRTGPVAPEIAASIEDAIRRSHSLSIEYTSLSDGKTTWRGVDPWVVVHRSEAWYLVGRCHRHDQPRTFRLDRIAAVLPIGGSFTRPADFDVDRWYGASWGVEASPDAVDVHIVFDRSVAPLIEHGCHHPREEKQPRADGHLDYRVRIGPLDELARWITGFAGAAVAVTPQELVDRVRSIAAGAATAHPASQRAAAMTRGTSKTKGQ
ncbi:MAG: helix-turn-helix transcriptional regulator [Thermoanaerobaculia bacterium]